MRVVGGIDDDVIEALPGNVSEQIGFDHRQLGAVGGGIFPDTLNGGGIDIRCRHPGAAAGGMDGNQPAARAKLQQGLPAQIVLRQKIQQQPGAEEKSWMEHPRPDSHPDIPVAVAALPAEIAPQQGFDDAEDDGAEEMADIHFVLVNG